MRKGQERWRGKRAIAVEQKEKRAGSREDGRSEGSKARGEELQGVGHVT